MADPASLDALPLFAALPAETRRALATRGVERQYRTGAVLFRAESEATALYVVLSGSIRVVRSHRGRQLVIHGEGPGGTLGEIPFFAGGTLPATAIAAEPCRCLIVNRETLQAVIRQDSALAWLFLRRLSLRVRDLVERLQRTSSSGVQARLASFILARAEAAGPGPFTLGLTQAELAEEIGTVREVVVRGLGQLRNSGIIVSAGRGHYAIQDPAALRTLANC